MRGFEIVSDNHRQHKEIDIKLPQRGDSKSAGYDFYIPSTTILEPGEKKLVFTDIKAYMQDDEVLMLHIRSSVGIKQGVVLSNITGVIDSSYYNNISNEGNIGLSLWNTSNNVVIFKEGDRIAQGVFTKYLVADNDNTIHTERTGGIGSSNR